MTFNIRAICITVLLGASVLSSCSTHHNAPKSVSWSLDKQFEFFSKMQFNDKYLNYLANARVDEEYVVKANTISQLQERTEDWLLVQNINVEYQKNEIELYFEDGGVWNKYSGQQSDARLFSDHEGEKIDTMISQLNYRQAVTQTALCETFISHPDIIFITIKKDGTVYNFTSVGDVRSDCYNVDMMNIVGKFGDF